MLSLLDRIESRANTKVVLVARSLNIMTRVTSEITIVCTKRVIRSTNIISLFASPGRPCAQSLLHSVPRVGRAYSPSTKRLCIVRKSIPSLRRLPGGNYHFTRQVP